MAASIKRSGRYSYRIRELSDQRCTIEFFESGESAGVSTFAIEDAQKAGLLKVLEQATGDATWFNRRADYDRMLDALTIAKAAAGVKNTATAFGLLLDLAERHLGELPMKDQSTACKEAMASTANRQTD